MNFIVLQIQKEKNQIRINSKPAFLNDGVLTSEYGSITFYNEQTVPYHLNEGQYIAKVGTFVDADIETCKGIYKADSVTIYEIKEINRKETIEWMTENGINLKNNCSYYLRVAVDAGYNCLIQYLIESGTDVNNADGYPLRKAAGKGLYESVRLLVESGAENFWFVMVQTFRHQMMMLYYMQRNITTTILRNI